MPLFKSLVDDAEADRVKRIKKNLITEFRFMIDVFLLRRTKAEAHIALPPISEVVVFTHMTSMQRYYYKNILSREVFPEKTSNKISK